MNDSLSLERATEINANELQREIIELSGHLAFWTQKYADAQVESATKKAALEQTEARISLMRRAERETKGQKATEALLQELVHTDDEWGKAKSAHILAEGNRLRVGGIVDAINAKKDMLVTLAAHLRAEMAAFPSVSAGAAARAHNRHSSPEDWANELKR